MARNAKCQASGFSLFLTNRKALSGSRCCKPMCKECRVPICKECNRRLRSFHGKGNIPMSFANDNYYCYTHPQVASGDVTWLECAAASVVWSTLLVCYMEEPFGHLMLEKMDGAQARTRVKGNLFSFVLPWGEIANCCKKAMDNQSQAQDGKKRRRHDHPLSGVAVPLSED